MSKPFLPIVSRFFVFRPPHNVINSILGQKLPLNNHIRHVASYEEVKAAGNNTNTLIIDVREPSELKETGTLPGSVNIPLGEIQNVLSNMSPQKFKEVYGRDKPNADSPVIMSCKSGKRGAQAQEIARRLGFSNVKNYGGGWSDWEQRNK